MPERIQRKRTKGWRMPPNTKYVGRGTRWGNPFGITQVGHAFFQRGFPAPIARLRSKASIERCLDMYTAWLKAQMDFDMDFLLPLHGKNLACWCPLDKPCHADIILRLLRTWSPDEENL